MGKTTEKEIFPSNALILDPESKGFLSTYLKMYQLYYNIDKAFLFENTLYNNHFVRISIGKEDTVFPWLEFMMYEIVDLVNNLYTIAEGTYTATIKTNDFLKSLSFDIFWEQLEDWAEYLTLKDFEDDLVNIEYIFKMFKCTEHWREKHDQFPKIHKDIITDLMVDIDEYYANFISEELEENTSSSEINAGVIPLEEGKNTFDSRSNPDDDSDDDNISEEDSEEEEEEKERKIKVDIIIPKIEKYGIYTSR